MRKITDIYAEYKIMPNLQLHQLRVAAVAKQICESLDIKIDANAVVIACLLHDMGNIIKFNLEYFPEFNQPQGIEYWQKVKDDYIQKYGPNEHNATVKIVQELDLSEHIVRLTGENQFGLMCTCKDTDDIEMKIMHYADSRVGPYGVLSYDDRMGDAKERYKNHKSNVEEEARIKLVVCGKEIESQIFSHTNITPEDITDESVAKIIEQLKNFEI